MLELGGKSAAIVGDDADRAAFETDVRWGMSFHAGQVCSAMSHVIVHESVHDDRVAHMVGVVQPLTVTLGIGQPAFGPKMGALVPRAQRDRDTDLIKEAQTHGARVATGGRKINTPGAFLDPTILTDVTSDMLLANDGVFPRSLDRATAAARRLRAGPVFVNEWYASSALELCSDQERRHEAERIGHECFR